MKTNVIGIGEEGKRLEKIIKNDEVADQLISAIQHDLNNDVNGRTLEIMQRFTNDGFSFNKTDNVSIYKEDNDTIAFIFKIPPYTNDYRSYICNYDKYNKIIAEVKKFESDRIYIIIDLINTLSISEIKDIKKQLNCMLLEKYKSGFTNFVATTHCYIEKIEENFVFKFHNAKISSDQFCFVFNLEKTKNIFDKLCNIIKNVENPKSDYNIDYDIESIPKNIENILKELHKNEKIKILSKLITKITESEE